MSKFEILLCLLTIISLSCSRDTFEPEDLDCASDISYNNGVKEILDASCAYSGCHDGIGGIGPGDYGSYAGMLADLQNGSFENRVIFQKDDPTFGMPPNVEIYPQSLVSDLTEEQLDIISCWLEAGFPEN